MNIGIPAERKTDEGRVAVTPAAAQSLVDQGHTVRVEQAAGQKSGFSDEAMESGGAIVCDADEVWAASDLIVKVKEPLSEEYRYLRPDLTVFTYLHLAANPPLADVLLSKSVTAIAYETVQTDSGRLPLLEPMSEIAGRISILVASAALSAHKGGRGILISGSPGVRPAEVVIVGGGTVGLQAAVIATGLRCSVTIFEAAWERVRVLDQVLGDKATVVAPAQRSVREAVLDADVVIGAVLLPGARAPRLATRQMLKSMRPGAVLVDVAIDQGGCFETSRPTTHSDPTYVVDDVVHYCVSNMPGAYPATATLSLVNSTLPFVELIANSGVEQACRMSAELRRGVNTHGGEMTHPAVAKSLGRPYNTDPISPP